MSRDTVGRLGRLLALLLGIQLAAVALIAASEVLVPDRLIVEELEEAFDDGVLTQSLVQSQRTGGLTDHYGECVLLTVGLGAPPGTGVFERVATSPNLHHCVATFERLQAASAGDPLTGSTKIRYWNGTSIISRPVVATVGVTGLRLLSAVAFVAATAWLSATISRLLGRLAAAGFVVALLTIDPVGLVEVFHHPLMLAVGFGGVVLVMRAAADGDRWQVATVAVGAGAVYNVLDLMNFVTGVLALVSALAAAALPAGTRTIERALVGLVAAVAWSFGYLATWFGAWALAALATSPSAVFAEIRDQFAFRLDGEAEGISADADAGLRAVIDAWLDPPLTRLVLVLVVVVLAATAPRVVRAAGAGALPVVMAPALLPLPFALVANNHHQAHFWFEYRALGMSLAIVLVAWAAAGTGRWAGATGPRPEPGSTEAPPADQVPTPVRR